MNHHHRNNLPLLLIYLIFFVFVSFQETHSQESPTKLGYGSQCTPHPKSKRILGSPQKIINLEKSFSDIHKPSFTSDDKQEHNLIEDIDSVSSTNKEKSSGFRRNQLRKKLLRGIMERAKRQAGDEDSKNEESTTESSRTGDNELSTSTTTTVIMSGSDVDMSSTTGNNGPSGAEITTSTIKSLVETSAPSSSQPSSISTSILPDESAITTTTPLSIDAIRTESTSSSILPTSFMPTSHQPDGDNSGHGQEDHSKDSPLITPEAEDSAMRVSITTSRTEEIVSSTLTPAVDVTATTMTMTAAATADQEVEKVPDKTSSYAAGTSTDSISIITPGIDSSSTQPVEMTSSSGSPGEKVEEATTTSMPTSIMGKDASLESVTSPSSNFLSSQGATLEEASTSTPESSMQSNAPIGVVTGSMKPSQMFPSSTTEEMTIQKMVSTTDIPKLFALKSTTEKAEESDAQEGQPDESNGMGTASSGAGRTTDVPHEDKSIVNNPPSTKATGDQATEGGAPPVVNTEAVSSSTPSAMSDLKTTVTQVMSTSFAPQMSSDVPSTTNNDYSVSSLEKPSAEADSSSIETASSSILTTEASTTTTSTTENVKVVSTYEETADKPQMTSTTEPTKYQGVEVSSPPDSDAAVPKMTSTEENLTSPVGVTSNSPAKPAETNDPSTSSSSAPPVTTTTVRIEPTTISESSPPPPHTSEVSSPAVQCDSSLSLECSDDAPHVCVCNSGLIWNEATKKCVSSSASQFNNSCTENSSCNTTAFLLCRDSMCRCEDETYQRWDEILGSCVSVAGTKSNSKCDLKEDNLGRQLRCVAHATCKPQEGQNEHLGTCECDEGFENNWMGICNSSGNSLGVFKAHWGVAISVLHYLTVYGY